MAARLRNRLRDSVGRLWIGHQATSIEIDTILPNRKR
jgi:hypothetical protein